MDSNRKHFRIIEQLEAATVSISNNIAEGKGRNSNKEFIRYLYISRGTLHETVSILTIFKIRKWNDELVYEELEIHALEIVKMLKGLIYSLYNR